jgi:hypothetical protein
LKKRILWYKKELNLTEKGEKELKGENLSLRKIGAAW